MNAWREYRPLDGEDIEETAQRMISLAGTKGGLVRTPFNGIDLLAFCDTNPKDLTTQVLQGGHDRVYLEKRFKDSS